MLQLSSLHLPCFNFIRLSTLAATLLLGTALAPQARAQAACRESVRAQYPGLNGTRAGAIFDRDLQTAFRSNAPDYQDVVIDLGCVQPVAAVRRFMVGGERAARGQGEVFEYSQNGSDWYRITPSNSTGWQDYQEFTTSPGWYGVSYGWSHWLRPIWPLHARYIRFLWRGDDDALGEIEINRLGTGYSSTDYLDEDYNLALELDGEGDYVEVSNGIPALPQAFSVDAWVKTYHDRIDQAVISRYKFDASNLDDSFLLAVSQGKVRFQIAPGSAYHILLGTSNVADGNWHHIAGTYDGSRMKVYVDGVLEAEKAEVTGRVNNPADTKVRIGAMYQGSSNAMMFFDGELDEVRLWSGARWYAPGDVNVPVRDPSSNYPLHTAWRFNGYLDRGPSDLAFIGDAVEVPEYPGYLGNFNLVLGNRNDSYVEIGTAPLQISTALTVEAVVNPIRDEVEEILYSRGPDLQSIVSKYRHDSGSNDDDSFFLGIEPSGVARFQVAAGGSYRIVNGRTLLENSGRHHLAGVYTGSALLLYVDGVLEGSVAYSGRVSPALNTPLLIGASQGSQQREHFFRGAVDDVRLWNVARTAAEIRQGLPHSQLAPGLLGNWQFEGDALNFVSWQNGATTLWGRLQGSPLFCESPDFVCWRYSTGYDLV